MLANLAHPLQTNGRLFVFWVRNLRSWYATCEDIVAQKPQQAGDEGQRHEHGDGHGRSCCDSHGGQEWNSDNRQRCERDNHGDTSEDDGGTSSTGSHAHRMRAGLLIHLLELCREFLRA